MKKNSKLPSRRNRERSQRESSAPSAARAQEVLAALVERGKLDIMGLQVEMLSEADLQTRQAEVAEFFHTLPPARVVIEVGTHSAWIQEIIAGEGQWSCWPIPG